MNWIPRRKWTRACFFLLFAAGLILQLAACGDDPGADVDLDVDLDDDTSFAGAEAMLAEGDVFATMSENGVVRLGLTEDRVYFELSEAVREHVDSAIRSDLEESDSRIGRSIGSAVRRGVAGALDVEIDYAVDDIRDVDYRAGELVFEFVDEDDGRMLDNAEVDDEPLTRAFAAEDARAFVAAFRRVKAGDASPVATDTVPVSTDTAGGGSF